MAGSDEPEEAFKYIKHPQIPVPKEAVANPKFGHGIPRMVANFLASTGQSQVLPTKKNCPLVSIPYNFTQKGHLMA
jgi:hypothetical protein